MASSSSENLNSILPLGAFKSLLQSYADSTSTHLEMFFLPTLTVISGLMGRSTARTHKEEVPFKEPNILWTCVAAPPGSRKTLALTILADSLSKLDLGQPNPASDANASFIADVSPRLWTSNESFTMASLHDQMATNDGMLLNLMDEIEGLFESFEVKGRPDIMDRKVWLTLNAGAKWNRLNRSGLKEMHATRLNYAGFIQPKVLKKRLEREHLDGMFDRHLVCQVQRRSMPFREIAHAPREGQDFATVFQAVFSRHNQVGTVGETVYCLDDEAGELFEQYFDGVEGEIKDITKRDSEEEPIIGVLNKSSGYLLRLAMVYQATVDACEKRTNTECKISKDSLIITINIMRFLTNEKRKFMMCTATTTESRYVNPDSGEFANDDFSQYEGLVKRLMGANEREWTPRDLVQRKLCPAEGRTYTTAKAKRFLSRLTELGLGEITATSKRPFVFKRKQPEDIPEGSKRFCP